MAFTNLSSEPSVLDTMLTIAGRTKSRGAGRGGARQPGPRRSVGPAAMLWISEPGGRPRLRPAFVPLLLPLFFLLLLLPGPARPISFQLPGKARKCLREEIHRDTLVTGEYEVAPPPGSATGASADLKITDSAGHTLYAKEDATKGKFAFTTEDYDMFEACFESKLPVGTGRMPDQLVTLNMKHGVEAKNYEEIAKVEKLKPLELELRRLEDLSESIVNDFAYMKQREEEMRDTNESTNIRVLYFSIFSMFCLIGLATWQVFYLRRFFKAKKLIE
ncbi:transmembrane emp24 domain-containing protein 10 [Sphaerodactylus townsendi]|uniref:transmembrane emp24 domain-containing protein 10 n=1 Tax=Sphaerodactylus townsendi TaxID=933632 RepID=UPI0020262FC5|nr:transmembrane emp24 domain-containing protein 10 [Sphaerodactylus townsendi]